MKTLFLYNTNTKKLQPYPRADDLPVVGLDSMYRVLVLVQEPQPETIPAGNYSRATEFIDLEASTVTRSFELVAIIDPPVVVTFRSLAFALQSLGLYEQVKAAALATTEGEIWWNTVQSATVPRDHPFVKDLGKALGQTPEQLDAIFAAALKLPQD